MSDSTQTRGFFQTPLTLAKCLDEVGMNNWDNGGFPQQFLSVPTRVSIGRWEEVGQLIICRSPCPPNPDCQSSTTGTRATKKFKQKIMSEKGFDSPIKCDTGKTKWNYSSHTAKNSWKKEQQEQKPMKGGEPIIHCDRDESTSASVKSTRRTAPRRQKSTNPPPEKWPTKTWREKKTQEEPNTINSLLFGTFSPTKTFFLSSVFLWFDSPRRKLVPRMCNMKQKKQFTTTGKEGREEKNPQNCSREEKSLRT